MQTTPPMPTTPPIPVLLARRDDYSQPGLSRTVGDMLDGLGLDTLAGRELSGGGLSGVRVLVKPNLVSATRGSLACSEPAVVAAACAWLLDAGCKPFVADSPAFGSARGVARACGLSDALKPLGLSVSGLGRPRQLRLSDGTTIGLSRTATQADFILNLPRLKAHCQMRVTGAVKNLFGCVSGVRKALAHSRYGRDPARFAGMILEVVAALPPAPTLLDAVTAMHITGPSGGEPFKLGFMAASPNPLALDTAALQILQLAPDRAPLWAEAARRGLLGADPKHLKFPGPAPGDFDATGFVVPDQLDSINFTPPRLAQSILKRLRHRLSTGADKRTRQ